jgi:hypothetical protein
MLNELARFPKPQKQRRAYSAGLASRKLSRGLGQLAAQNSHEVSLTGTTSVVAQELLERIGVNRSKTKSEVQNGCPA